MNKKYMKGFTLIEVMIVVAIVAIISSIALPSYTEFVRKGKRADAKVELLRIAQIQEDYFVQNLSYARSLTDPRANGGLGFSNVLSEQEVYEIRMTPEPAGCSGLPNDSCSSFTLSADPLDGQAADKCGTFTLDNTGAKGSGDVVKDCWR